MSHAQQNQESVVIATAVATLLDSIERSQTEQHLSSPALAGEIQLATANHPQLRDPKFIESSINSDPTLKQRVLAASSAASLEAVKVLFPALGVAIEAVRAFQAPGSHSDT